MGHGIEYLKLLGSSYEQMHHLTFDMVCACNCCREGCFVWSLPHHTTLCARRQLLTRDQRWTCRTPLPSRCLELVEREALAATGSQQQPTADAYCKYRDL